MKYISTQKSTWIKMALEDGSQAAASGGGIGCCEL
jgi:hypothetical protein